MMHACVVFSTWINSSQSSWSNPLTSDRILIGDRAASLSVDLPLSGDGINSCPSSSSSSTRSSQSVALISCHRFHRSIPLRKIIVDGKLINEDICVEVIHPCKQLCVIMTKNYSNVMYLFVNKSRHAAINISDCIFRKRYRPVSLSVLNLAPPIYYISNNGICEKDLIQLTEVHGIEILINHQIPLQFRIFSIFFSRREPTFYFDITHFSITMLPLIHGKKKKAVKWKILYPVILYKNVLQ